ncbi:hypothetical protein B0H17DRAFT_1194700 [Mycena rosella]|uniref:Uncharacterized protein n=1 Tax=Mycena rosella TaxID=1033263 RepID=A0AAD7GR06_MYCRO|nr:hypothetical protein B0H17DRAFT_1194700 [Mycena rosella]
MVINFGLSTIFPMELSGTTPRWRALREAGGDNFPLLWPGPDNPHVIERADSGRRCTCRPPRPAGRVPSGPTSLRSASFSLTGRFSEFSEEGKWEPDVRHRHYEDEEDFLRRIMSVENPESYAQLKAHRLWREYEYVFLIPGKVKL